MRRDLLKAKKIFIGFPAGIHFQIFLLNLRVLLLFAILLLGIMQLLELFEQSVAVLLHDDPEEEEKIFSLLEQVVYHLEQNSLTGI